MDMERHDDDDLEPLEVMEAMAYQVQDQEDYESEDALDTFEAHASVRKRIQEKKTMRGHTTPTPAWQLTGTVRGKIKASKSRTKCHLRKRTGHWQRECCHSKTEKYQP